MFAITIAIEARLNDTILEDNLLGRNDGLHVMVIVGSEER